MYVGITTNLKTRWSDHKKHNNHKSCPGCYSIHFAMKKYGIDNFIFKNIEKFQSWEEACLREIEWIKILKTYGYQLYNETLGGEGHFGKFGPINLTLEEREKRSKRISGKNNYFCGKKLYGSANGHYGHKMLPKVKEKLLSCRRKVTDNQIEEIKQKYKDGITQTELARMFNMSLPGIHDIVKEKCWAGGKQIVTKKQLTLEQVQNIRALKTEGKYNQTQLAKMFNVSTAQISRIINMKKWKIIS